MVVTVNVTALNIRSTPSVTAPIVGTLSQGQTVTVVGATHGDLVEGSNYWWITSAGTYIWTGGTLQQPNPNSVQ
jgi:uncharacterized protein YraI